MPTTKRPYVKRSVTEKLETGEDIQLDNQEPIILREKKSSRKEIPITNVISETISDNLSKTISYGVSGNMLKTVGKDYAITPPEMYNIIHPTFGIIKHYTPNIVISSKIPQDVADNLALIVTTGLEYLTRIVVVSVEHIFHLQVRQEVPVSNPQPVPQPNNQTQYPVRKTSIVPPKPMSDEDIADLFPSDEATITDDLVVPMKPTGVSPQDLVENGVIVGDIGQVMW